MDSLGFLIELQLKAAIATINLRYSMLKGCRDDCFHVSKKFPLAVTFKNKSVQIKPHMLPLCAERVCFELYNYHPAHLWVKLWKKENTHWGMRFVTHGRAGLACIICITDSCSHCGSLCGNSDHSFVFVVVLVGAETFPGSVGFYK